MKLGKKTQRKCKWCGQWEVYECAMPHSGILGVRLSCKDCNNTGLICNSPKHPNNKPRWDV
jgi:hypothetical protein